MIGLLATLLVPTATGADSFGGYTFYLGDIHAHSGVSGDGGSADLGTTCLTDCGNFEDLFQTARDNGLDFAAVSDHVNGVKVPASSSDLDLLIDLAIAEDDAAGGFITLPAAEVWLRAGGSDLGHQTLLMFGDNTVLSGLAESDMQPMASTAMEVGTCGAITTWATNLEATYGDLLLVPHHPAATLPMPTDWSCHDESFAPMVEIYSEHGSSLGDGTGYDDMWSREASGSTVHDAIDPDLAALRLGFAAGTDKHNSRPGDVCNLDDEMPRHPYGGGLTIVVADETETYSRDLIHDAMVAHRTLASTGPLVPVTIDFSSGGADLGSLGDDLGLPTDQELDVAVAVPADLAAYVTGVELVTPAARFPMTDDGGGEFTLTLDAADAVGFVYAAVEIDGATWYGSAGCDDGGSDDLEYVWTSPSYIDAAAADLDNDGMAYLDGDCDDGADKTYAGAEDLPDDGIDQDCDGEDVVTETVTAEASGDTASEATAAEASAEAEASTTESATTTDGADAGTTEEVTSTDAASTETASTDAVESETTESAEPATSETTESADSATSETSDSAETSATAEEPAAEASSTESPSDEVSSNEAAYDPDAEATCSTSEESSESESSSTTASEPATRPWRDGIRGHHSEFPKHRHHRK